MHDLILVVTGRIADENSSPAYVVARYDVSLNAYVSITSPTRLERAQEVLWRLQEESRVTT